MTLRIRLSLVASMMAITSVVCHAEANTGGSVVGQAKMELLIEQLGASQYAHRERAREELQSLGVTAFESLHAAQFHPDVEIRKQAAYLLRAIRISWVQDSDSEEVRRVLGNYQDEDHEQRLKRLDELSRIEGDAGVVALCRLARFETSEIVSKQAALAVLKRAETPHDVSQFVARVEPLLGASRRPAVQWLMAYAHGLMDPDAVIDEWDTLCQQEVDFVRKHPDKERRSVLQDLLRWHVAMLHRQTSDSKTSAAMQQLLAVHSAADADILDTADWLIDIQAWPLFEQLEAQFPDRFREYPHLRYRVAESLLRQGRTEEADALAQEILAMRIDDRPFLHVELGYTLQMRGLIDWAEQAYRHTIENSDLNGHAAIESSIRLGWMFHDLGRHQEAYEAYRPLVESMDKTPAIKERIQELSHQPATLRGQMHFSRGLFLGEQQKYAQQATELEKAIAHDRENADILIAMHRIPGMDEMWQAKTKRLIDALRLKYEKNIVAAELETRKKPGQSATRTLAQQLNQFAWLVSNTYGDFQLALKRSQRSLDLIAEDGGYLDTLARCHYAVGDLQRALSIQRRAVQLEPNSGQIRRQLEFFEARSADPEAS